MGRKPGVSRKVKTCIIGEDIETGIRTESPGDIVRAKKRLKSQRDATLQCTPTICMLTCLTNNHWQLIEYLLGESSYVKDAINEITQSVKPSNILDLSTSSDCFEHPLSFADDAGWIDDIGTKTGDEEVIEDII